jgi:molybdopterin/thiamine biosynthesis adenylyltransferase
MSMEEGVDRFDRIEPETESHRSAKALRQLVERARLPLKHGHVEVVVPSRVAREPAGQHLLLMLVQLLARMKGVVHRVSVREIGDVPRVPGVPLEGNHIGVGLQTLVDGLSGAASEYRCDLDLDPARSVPHVSVGLGDDSSADIRVGADGWRALTGEFVNLSEWSARAPIGPYLAACFAAAEVFKLLLKINFQFSEFRPIGNAVLSLIDYSQGPDATVGPDVDSLELSGITVAGAGAGGTAALYALASFAQVTGRIGVVDPGKLKESNLGRYLLSDYNQVHEHLGKVDSVKRFFARHAPDVTVDGYASPWHETPGPWRRVLCAVDTPEARWDVQGSAPEEIIEAGTMNGTLYAALRIVPGGWCLECKHPRDPELMWKRRSQRWGLPVEEIRRRYADQIPIAHEDLERLSQVQGRPADEFRELLGIPFDQAPRITECGETPLSLRVPSQAPVLPFATTAVGVVLAAEAVKSLMGLGTPLSNYFVHDLRFRLRADALRFMPRRLGCPSCR